jgi:hypothetical protein
MPGIGLNITFDFHEVNPDGSRCSSCGQIIITSMHKLYVSVNTSEPTNFDMIPSKYQFCEDCKIKVETKL